MTVVASAISRCMDAPTSKLFGVKGAKAQRHFCSADEDEAGSSPLDSEWVRSDLSLANT